MKDMKKAFCHKNKKHYAKGLCSLCYNKPNWAKWRDKWRKENSDWNLDYHLKTRYGISLQEYKDLLIKQNGSCAICQKQSITIQSKENKIKRLSVDHDHKTGRVRGLLCQKCNVLLGMASDNIVFLTNAIEYLKQ